MGRIWSCKIGEADCELPSGSDLPMRRAVEAAYKALTGEDDKFLFSGWGAELTDGERAVVEDRLPNYVKDVPDALTTIRFAMQSDQGFAWSWHCNLAMLAVDAGAPHCEANIRAADFMKTAFGVDVTGFPEYRSIVR